MEYVRVQKTGRELPVTERKIIPSYDVGSSKGEGYCLSENDIERELKSSVNVPLFPPPNRKKKRGLHLFETKMEKGSPSGRNESFS